MNSKEYIAQNAKGYEGDEFIHDEITKLCAQFRVSTIIETGTFRGATTKRFASLAEKVITIEFSDKYYPIAKETLVNVGNVTIIKGDSAKELPAILSGVSGGLLCFLDAHWEKQCPLLDEMKAIADARLKPVIVIHDFKVPGTDFGYDSYNGQDFEFEWIRPSVENIYGKDYSYHYNSQAEGARRGVIFIYPK